MLRSALVAAAVAALAVSTTAQVTTNAGQLIGFTSGGSALAPLIQRQQLCQPSQRVCPTGMAPATGWAGGAAYNAINGSLWHTQGTRMAEVRIADCALLCSTAANLVLGPGSVASGLAICESRYELYQLESILGFAALSVRHLRSCPLNVLRVCRFALPTPQHAAGAVTVDDEAGLFYYATSVFGPTTTVNSNIILVARQSDPCNIICRIQVPNCANTRLGAITAMAWDGCRNILYVSDGQTTMVLRRDPTTVCNLIAVSCCTVGPSVGTWHGFDVEPSHPEPVGQSCLGPLCVQCNRIALTTTGDPVIGNPAFALDVVDGQPGTSVLLALGPGPCSVPGIALLCGRWHVPSPAFLAPFGLFGSGMAVCDGTAHLPIPIPKVPQLCGLQVCAQAILICPSGGLGLTNALDMTITN